MISGTPPVLHAMTGRLIAMASTIASPNGSQ
jgi:hypothetical protein